MAKIYDIEKQVNLIYRLKIWLEEIYGKNVDKIKECAKDPRDERPEDILGSNDWWKWTTLKLDKGKHRDDVEGDVEEKDKDDSEQLGKDIGTLIKRGDYTTHGFAKDTMPTYSESKLKRYIYENLEKWST